MHLDEIVFGINSKKSMEETGSNNNMFLGWSIRTRIPNSVDPNADTHAMIKQRINKRWTEFRFFNCYDQRKDPSSFNSKHTGVYLVSKNVFEAFKHKR